MPDILAAVRAAFRALGALLAGLARAVGVAIAIRIRAAIAARRIWPDRPDWAPGELLAMGQIPRDLHMRHADARRRALRRLADQ